MLLWHNHVQGSAIHWQSVSLLLQSDMENSSTCWIAFVQQYNLPSLVLGRKEDVKEVCVNNFFPSRQVLGIPSELGPQQLITVICPPEGEESPGSCIDYVTAEHVQCCGHQVHISSIEWIMVLLISCINAGFVQSVIMEFDWVHLIVCFWC